MTYLTNTTASLLETDAAKASPAAGPSIWQRLYAAMIESRRRAAIRELQARSHLIGEAEIVLGGFPQTALSDDAKLPFNR